MIDLQLYSFSGSVAVPARAGGCTGANLRRRPHAEEEKEPRELEREGSRHAGGLDRSRPRPGAPSDPCAYPAQGRRGRGGSQRSLVRHEDRRRPGGQSLDGLSGAHPFRGGGTGGRSRPSRSTANQAAEARWLPGGASDRARLLGASEGEEALERASSGRAFREPGVHPRAHLPGVGPAHPQKSAIKPWLSGRWSIPPKQDAEFVWRMEDVLSVYTRPYDERFPQVCLDEKSKQLISKVREPLAASPGRPARHDYEYERNGTANLFIVCEPLAGWRHISVTQRRTKIDWANCIRELVDFHYPRAEQIVLVMDNLNTHTPAALYEAFAPAEARRLCQKLEIHYTPKHGSWLNMAEIELSVLSRQCLDRRIPDLEALAGEVGAWQAERNAAESSIDWRFTSAEARIKLKHLYPEVVEESSYDPNLS